MERTTAKKTENIVLHILIQAFSRTFGNETTLKHHEKTTTFSAIHPVFSINGSDLHN